MVFNMLGNIPSQSISRFEDFSIDPYLDLWPTLSEDSEVENGIQYESRKQLLYWGRGCMSMRWPERYGPQGDLADIFAQELHELLDNYRCRELADFMFEMEFPKLRSNIPLGSLPTIRANFITERIVDATVQASRSNRYPHLDSIINITPEFDPLRGSISTSGDTQFLNNGITISIYNVGDEGSLALYDPRAAKHFAPYRFDGVRYTLLFEHTKTRYNIQALRDFALSQGVTDQPFLQVTDSGLALPLTHNPSDETFDSTAALSERYFLKGIFEAAQFGRKISSERLKDLHDQVARLRMLSDGSGLRSVSLLMY